MVAWITPFVWRHCHASLVLHQAAVAFGRKRAGPPRRRKTRRRTTRDVYLSMRYCRRSDLRGGPRPDAGSDARGSPAVRGESRYHAITRRQTPAPSSAATAVAAARFRAPPRRRADPGRGNGPPGSSPPATGVPPATADDCGQTRPWTSFAAVLDQVSEAQARRREPWAHLHGRDAEERGERAADPPQARRAGRPRRAALAGDGGVRFAIAAKAPPTASRP